MSEMVDRAARAICHAECPLGCEVEKCLEFTDWLVEARAAIAAMREPTEAMIQAAWSPDTPWGPDRVVATWHEMVDEALADG